MGTKISARVINGEVCVRCSEIIKSLYMDLSYTDDEATKTYIKSSIREWEEYENRILNQANKQ